MMGSVNKVILVGYLGKDPEMRYLPNGDPVASFSVATSEQWKDKNGDKQQSTEWHNVVIFGKLAEICGKYLKKGSQAYLEGKLKTRKWEDKNGQDRYTTEIVCHEMKMLGGGKESGQRTTADDYRKAKDGGQKKASSRQVDEFDSDIPFN